MVGGGKELNKLTERVEAYLGTYAIHTIIFQD